MNPALPKDKINTTRKSGVNPALPKIMEVIDTSGGRGNKKGRAG